MKLCLRFQILFSFLGLFSFLYVPSATCQMLGWELGFQFHTAYSYYASNKGKVVLGACITEEGGGCDQ